MGENLVHRRHWHWTDSTITAARDSPKSKMLNTRWWISPPNRLKSLGGGTCTKLDHYHNLPFTWPCSMLFLLQIDSCYKYVTSYLRQVGKHLFPKIRPYLARYKVCNARFFLTLRIIGEKEVSDSKIVVKQIPCDPLQAQYAKLFLNLLLGVNCILRFYLKDINWIFFMKDCVIL